MGATSTHLKISENLEYDGQAIENIPHGSGKLTKYFLNPQKNVKQVSWIIEGIFIKGQITNCKVISKDVQIQGLMKQGKLNGPGKMKNKKLGLTFVGDIQNGIIKKGNISQENKFQCKGELEQIQDSQLNQDQAGQNQKTMLYALYGKEIQYVRLENKEKLSGQFGNGQLEGNGIYKFSNQDIYKGNFKKGLFQGPGIYTSKNISITGNFSGALPNSNSEQNHIVKFSNGDTYIGKMRNGNMHGSQGTYTYRDGTIYKGAFYHNTMTGDCQITYSKSSPLQNYKGEVSQGLYNGLGVLQFKNGIIFKGYFLKNCKNGPSILIYGQRMFKCLYIMNQLMGQLYEIPMTNQS